MAELFTNLARSTLASGISAGAVLLTVQSGDGNDLFPALGGGDFFTCLLFKKSTGDVEFIKVTARTGDAFTITRAQEQIGNITATAFAFDAGDIIELRPTKGFFDSLTLTTSSIQSGEFLYGGTDTGSANVYAFALSPVVVAYTAGMRVRCKIGATNTGASTLNLNAVAATAIKMEDGTDPPAGAIRSGFTHTFTYDGTNFILQSTGLALTAAAGYNALNKQIKNVAAGTAATDVGTIGGTETHTNKTYTSPIINSPVINTGVSGTAVKDEDDMVSDSATHLATQQSIKAYADSKDFTTGTFIFTSLANSANTTARIAHGLGNIPVDFGASVTDVGGTVLVASTCQVRAFTRENSKYYSLDILGDVGTSPTMLDGEVGVGIRNSSGAARTFHVNWWVKAI